MITKELNYWIAWYRKAAAGLLIHIVSALTTHAATVYDLRADWSDITNPNGAWAYHEGTNALPHVDWWQRSLGGWTTAQPGWARCEDCTSRGPFWFRSVGSETFTHDSLAGDILVHTTDPTAGVGNGLANITWTSPVTGTIDITGSIWAAADFGRANDWSLWVNGTMVTSGTIGAGDAYSRATPFDLAAGSGGSSVLNDISVSFGDEVMLQVAKTSTSSHGSIAGVNLTITADASTIAPTVNAGADATITVGSTFTGTGAFEDPDDDDWTATVDYDDGSGVQALTLHTNKTFSLNHAYTNRGIYTVVVRVTDDAGGLDRIR